MDDDLVLQWDLALPDDRRLSFQLVVRDGDWHLVRDGDCTADLTVGLALADLLPFLAGDLHPLTAYAAGTIRLAGDPTWAFAVQRWFGAQVTCRDDAANEPAR